MDELPLAKAADETIQSLIKGPNQGGLIYKISLEMSTKEKKKDCQLKVHALPSPEHRVSFWKNSPELCDLYLQGLLFTPILECLEGQSLWSMLLVTWRAYVEWQ